jgi:hypothetical protein
MEDSSFMNSKAQCRATCKATGERCRKRPIAGAAVCRSHGGAAPQVREAAKRRILSLVDPALGALAWAVSKRRGVVPPAVQLAAAKEILDLAGIGKESRPADALTPSVTVNTTVQVGVSSQAVALATLLTEEELEKILERIAKAGALGASLKPLLEPAGPGDSGEEQAPPAIPCNLQRG